MKRCPECRRDYYDDTLVYCLDDGNALLEGPASRSEPGAMATGVSGADEPATAILQSTVPLAEAATRAQIHTAEQTAVLPKLTDMPITISFSRKKSLIVAAFGIIIVSALGVGSYFMYGRSSSKQIESIAVMPFVNDSGNADIEYLSDGMTEALIHSLTQIPKLNIKARSSVFRYKGKDQDAKTIGRELGVQAILTGRLVLRADQMTLGLELVDTTSENIIWSGQYIRKASDLASLQSAIAKDVSSELQLKLSSAETASVVKNYTADSEAYESYLRGRFFWNKRTPASMKTAIDQFQSAVDRDPNFALAYVGLADAQYLAAALSSAPLPPGAKASANRALAIDESLADAHATLGAIDHYGRKWSESENEFKRAIELNPKYATAHQWYSLLLSDLGRKDEALREIRLAYAADPLSRAVNSNLAGILVLTGDLNGAVEQCKRLIELDPGWPLTYLQLGETYARLGRAEEALQTVQKGIELRNRDPASLAILGEIYAILGRKSEALAVVKELQEMYSNKQGTGQDISMIFWELGDREQSFNWMLKDLQSHVPPNMELVRKFRDYPRFKEVTKEFDLPE